MKLPHSLALVFGVGGFLAAAPLAWLWHTSPVLGAGRMPLLMFSLPFAAATFAGLYSFHFIHSGRWPAEKVGPLRGAAVSVLSLSVCAAVLGFFEGGISDLLFFPFAAIIFFGVFAAASGLVVGLAAKYIAHRYAL